MRILATTVAAAALAFSTPALAANIDLSTWTCRQFQNANKSEVYVIMAWLDGYYKQEDDPPVVDTDQFADTTRKLADYCAAHPDAAFITATDLLFQRE